MTAYKIREVSRANGARGVQWLYRLDPPMTTDNGSDPAGLAEYVISSAIPMAFDHGGPETFVFPANSDGDIVSFFEQEGSQRGICDCDAAINAAGYTVVHAAKTSEPTS